MRLALAQLSVSAGDVEANREAAVDAVARGAEAGADLVVLPEQFAVGFFAFDRYADSAEPVGGPTHRALADAARDHGVAVLAGTLVEDLAATAATTDWPVPAEEGLANTAAFVDHAGEVRAVYRKHHLFGYDSDEARRLTPGETLATVDYGGFTVGMTTCYDLRFPELYRDLLDRGADLLLVPSAWPYPRVEHWRTLARARALENLSYLAAVNGVGEQGDAELLGRSALYDPWGTTVAGTGDDPDLVVADADPARVTEVREEFPALDDRRR